MNVRRPASPDPVTLAVLVMLATLAPTAITAAPSARDATPPVTGASGRDLDIQAHRGGRSLGPDNALPTFRRALAFGVPTLEMDVQLRDGQLFVAHDADFEPGAPTLDDVLALVAAAPGEPRVSIEIKAQRAGRVNVSEAARLVLEALDRHEMAGRAIVQSFNVDALRAVREIRADVPTAILTREGDDIEALLERSGADILSPSVDGLTRGRVERARALGARVIPWVVNDADAMRQFAAWGVDGIITDRPDLAMKTLGPSAAPAPIAVAPATARPAIRDLRDVRTLAVYPFTSGGNVDTFCTTLFTKAAQDRNLFTRLVDPYELPITTPDGEPFSPRELLAYLREEAAARGADAFLVAEGKWYDWGFRMEFRVMDVERGAVLWQNGWASGLTFSGPSAKRELVTKAARSMEREMR